MGLFDSFVKKKKVETQKSNDTDISQVERDVIQNIALCMNMMQITKLPTLSFFVNDKGIFDGFFVSHINDSEFDKVRLMYGNDMYLKLLACHSLGAGIYVCLSQSVFNKPVNDFTLKEATEINDAFRKTDVYELAIKSLGISVDSKKKQCLDKLVEVGVETYKCSSDSYLLDKNFLKVFMKVMYNAGISVVMKQ